MKTTLNYETFVNDNREYLETFRNKRVLVTYGGGKDASVIMHFFIKAKEDFNFEFETHAAMFPSHAYTKEEMQRLDLYWEARGVHIKWHTIGQSDSIFETARQNGENPCYECHSVKRKFFFEFLKSTITNWQSLVIIIGWSLWDIVGYSLEYLFGSVYSDREGLYQGKAIQDRFFLTAQRFYPMLKLKEGYHLCKPLIRYNDQDIINVINENKIPLLTTDCKYKDYRPKRLFAESYIKMDLYFDYDKVMKFAMESLKLHDSSAYTGRNKEDFITSLF